MITILITLFIAYCILFPKQMAASTADGLVLWYKNVLPTLLPFSILSYIIIQSDLYHAFFEKINRTFFQKKQIEIELLYPLTLGFVFGFPIGAKLLADLYENGRISAKNLTRCAAICNQFGPAFVVNYIGFIQLNNQIAVYKLLFAIYFPAVVLFASFLISSLFKQKLHMYQIHPANHILQQKKPVSRSYINFKTIDTGIINGFETMLRIAGYIVLFSILSGALNLLPGQYHLFQSLVTGLLEVTTGVNKTISLGLPLEISVCMICATVAFGGFCGLFQTKAIMKHCPFQINSYILYKCISSLFAAFIALILV